VFLGLWWRGGDYTFEDTELSQSAAISLATCHLAAEGQRSSLKIPFNGDLFCHTLTMLGGWGDYARNIPM